MPLLTNLLHYWDLTDDDTWTDFVGSWDLAEQGGTPDASGTAPDGSASCLDLESGEYLNQADVVWNGTGSARSISLWMNTDVAPAPAVDVPYSHGDVGGNDVVLEMSYSDVDFYFLVGDGTTSASVASTLGPPSTSTWYHLCGTTDGLARHKFFINGSLKVTDSTALNGTVAAGAEPFSIGSRNGTGIFSGNIFACGVWDRELTAPEAYQLYFLGKGLTYTQLEASGINAPAYHAHRIRERIAENDVI